MPSILQARDYLCQQVHFILRQKTVQSVSTLLIPISFQWSRVYVANGLLLLLGMIITDYQTQHQILLTYSETKKILVLCQPLLQRHAKN